MPPRSKGLVCDVMTSTESTLSTVRSTQALRGTRPPYLKLSGNKLSADKPIARSMSCMQKSLHGRDCKCACPIVVGDHGPTVGLWREDRRPKATSDTTWIL